MKDFLAVGNGELDGQPEIKKGDMFDCPHCGGAHPLECGKNPKTGVEDNFLLFYTCTSTGLDWLAGMNGKMLPFRKGEN